MSSTTSTGTTDPKKQTATLQNPVNDKNSGRIWPVITLLLAATVAWVLQDSELRGGLADVLGIKALAPIVEEIVTHEYEIKLFGTWTSTCTQRVMVVAKEKDLDIDLHLVDMAGKEHKTPEHLAKQPFGQIPVLEISEGHYLFESRAIATYLDLQYPDRGTSFQTNGSLGRTLAEQAASFEAFDFDPYAGLIFREAVMKPRNGLVPDETVIQAARVTLDSKLDAYDSLLSHRRYLGGQNLTLADLYHLPLGQKIIDAGYGASLMDDKRRPNVARWWKSLSSRPSWQGVLKDVETWQEAETERKRAEEEEEREKAAKEQN